MGKIRASSFYKNPKGRGRHGEILNGRPIYLQFAAALQNGPLPSHYIRALWHSPHSARDAIGFLRQEGVIRVPQEANRAFGRPRVFELDPKIGVDFLKDHGAYTELKRHGNGQYKHNHMTAVCEYLFDRLPAGVSKTTFPDKLTDFHIYPDGPFRQYAMVKRFNVAPEYDRGTENLRGLDRESIESKVQNYTAFLRARAYKQLGMNNCAFAFITLSRGRKDGILEVINEVAKDPNGEWDETDHFIVRALPDFIHWEKYPDPTDFLLTTNWEQTNGRTLNIHDILKGHNANRPQDALAAQGAA